MNSINKLPVELLTHIILLANYPTEKTAHPYLSYSWVCRHWRSILIQTPAFWTLFRYGYRQLSTSLLLYYELFRRSARLDIVISNGYLLYAPSLENIFAKESDRIRNLIIRHNDFSNDYDYSTLTPLILSGERFISLRGFSFQISNYDISRLLSVLVASEHLETMVLAVWKHIDIPTNEMALIFGRIRRLKLIVPSTVPSVRALLDYSVKLEKLEFKAEDAPSALGPHGKTRIILPELQLLTIEHFSVLDFLHAPKIASLDIRWFPRISNYQMSEDFDYSLIKYLYIRENHNHHTHYTSPRYCILGSKEPMHCNSMYPDSTSSDSDLFLQESSREHPRDCFHLQFFDYSWQSMLATALRELASLLFPRLINLIELHLLYYTPTLTELLSLSNDHSVPLLDYLQAPKLSSLNMEWSSTTPIPNCRIWNEFDFSSTKHLYIRRPEGPTTGDYCILGSKAPINDCKHFHSVTNGRPSELYDGYPRDCFHFMFRSRNTFAEALKLGELAFASSVLPQLTSLVELHLLFSCTLVDFRAIIAHVPHVKQVTVRHGCKLIDFIRLLNKASFLPELKHLSFATLLVPRNLETYANDVGEALTNCLQSRKADSGPAYELQLQRIVLRNCPPLPAIWLDALQKLGVTEIITEKDFKSIIIRSSRSHKWDSCLIDEEI